MHSLKGIASLNRRLDFREVHGRGLPAKGGFSRA
jgi:hypothetical protein